MSGATAVDARDKKLGAELVKAGIASEEQIASCLALLQRLASFIGQPRHHDVRRHGGPLFV